MSLLLWNVLLCLLLSSAYWSTTHMHLGFLWKYAKNSKTLIHYLSVVGSSHVHNIYYSYVLMLLLFLFLWFWSSNYCYASVLVNFIWEMCLVTFLRWWHNYQVSWQVHFLSALRFMSSSLCIRDKRKVCSNARMCAQMPR